MMKEMREMSGICVCMIVLNESESVVRTLEPIVRCGVEDILVFDTGSKDNTVGKIKSVYGSRVMVVSKNFQDMKYRDFSLMRNESLKLVRQIFKSKYILILDSEWILNGISNLIEFCNLNYEFDVANKIDFHLIKVNTKTDIHYRDFLILHNSNCMFHDPIHEYIIGKRGVSCPESIYFSWEPTPFSQDKSRRRWTHDIEIYKNLFEQNIINDRHLYYYGRTCYFLNDYNNALRFLYRRTGTLNETNPNEKYMAFIYIAEIFQKSNILKNAETYYNKAYNYIKLNLEAPIKLIKLYLQSKEYTKAYNISLKLLSNNNEHPLYYSEKFELFSIASFHLSVKNSEIIDKNIFQKGYLIGLKSFTSNNLNNNSNNIKEYINKYFYLQAMVKNEKLMSDLLASQKCIEEFDCEEFPYVTLAILVKDKEVVLPVYLKCIDMQNYPKGKIHLFIRTNNNKDNSKSILDDWVNKNGCKYASVYYDSSDVIEPIENYSPHEWNSIRFKVLGLIRQMSINYAILKKSHYFVCDCDNFIVPNTLINMVKNNKPVVGPLLKNLVDQNFRVMGENYTNTHVEITEDGFYKKSELENDIINHTKIGLFNIPVVHCTYFIQNKYLTKISYDYLDNQFEYITFSKSCRNSNIPQFIDNTQNYGFLTFANNHNDFNRFIHSHLLWLQ